MAFSLYESSVLTYLQILPAVSNCLEKGFIYSQEKGIELDSLVSRRIFPDMRPFSYQIHALVHHSLGAIEGLRRGVFEPPSSHPERSYNELRAHVAQARLKLEKVSPDEINDLWGKDLIFQVGENRRTFTAENFVMSFSLPNFYFHVTTAYAILRGKGVPIGKRDYLGAMRTKV